MLGVLSRRSYFLDPQGPQAPLPQCLDLTCSGVIGSDCHQVLQKAGSAHPNLYHLHLLEIGWELSKGFRLSIACGEFPSCSHLKTSSDMCSFCLSQRPSISGLDNSPLWGVLVRKSRAYHLSPGRYLEWPCDLFIYYYYFLIWLFQVLVVAFRIFSCGR